MKLERIYTVPLGDAYEAVRKKRVPKAVKLLRAFIERHMKAKGLKVTLSAALNEHLWAHSIQRPPRRIKVRLIKDDSTVRAYLSDETPVEPKKKDEKKEGKGAEEKKPAPKEEPKKAAPSPPEKPQQRPAEKKVENPSARPQAQAQQPARTAVSQQQKTPENKPAVSTHQHGAGEKR